MEGPDIKRRQPPGCRHATLPVRRRLNRTELNAMSNVDSSAAAANTPAAVGNSATVALFQKAHAKMVTLQRIDDQLMSLADQRKKLQEELRGIQIQINDEFDRLLPQLAADDDSD